MAHVIQNLNYGGMERVLQSLVRELPGRGFEIHVVVLEYFGRFAEGLGETATLHQVPRMSKLSLFRPLELAAMLRRIAPDVVHSHTGVWMKAARAAALAQVPVMVHTEHGRPMPDRRTDQWIDGLASRSTDCVIAVSESLADLLDRRIVHDRSRIRVIINGVGVSHLRPAADRFSLRQELGLPTDALVVGSIGRLEPVKNYALAIQALARLGSLPGAEDAAYLLLAGDGSERGHLERLALRLGVASQVKFLGWRSDPERIYGAFDVFTLTSRSEGTSISLLESMSGGVCPVVTDVGGNRAVLGPELEGLLVPDNDEIALAASWRRCLTDSAFRREMGRRAQLRVSAAFSLERMVEQHATLYRDLLSSSRT